MADVRTSRCLPALLLLLAWTLVPALGCGAQAAQPSVSLSQMSPAEAVVEVTASRAGAAEYAAELTVTKPPPGVAEVTMTANVSTGWPATASPAKFTISGSGATETVQVIVTVPAGTLAVDVGEVVLTATMDYLVVTQTATTQALAAVKQFYKFGVTAKPVSADRTAVVAQVVVTNEGNGPDSVVIDSVVVTGAASVLPDFDPSQISSLALPVGTTVNTTLKVPIKANASGGTVEVRITVASDLSKRAGVIGISKSTTILWKIPAETPVEAIANAISPVAGGLPAIIAMAVVGVVLFWFRARRRARWLRRRSQ